MAANYKITYHRYPYGQHSIYTRAVSEEKAVELATFYLGYKPDFIKAEKQNDGEED